jgi:STE24 endopeptidase
VRVAFLDGLFHDSAMIHSAETRSQSSQIIRAAAVRKFCASCAALILCLISNVLIAQTVSPPAVSGAVAFNVETATRAYLDKLPPEKKQRSDAYFEGGYWLQLWGFLYGLGIAAILLTTKLSAKMRDAAQRVTRFKFLHTVAYWTQYLVVTGLLAFPLTVYEGFFREHQYGMSNQTFGGWFWDLLKGLMVSVVMGGLLLAAIMAFVRRQPQRWHVIASIVMVAFACLAIMIGPVFIAPLFNKYTVLADAKVRDPILRLARANGIPATEVFEMDASRQTKRISANVSGAFGTTRITLNDNLLARCTPAAIEAVMGHEMGHYVLNHIYKMLITLCVIIVVMMTVLRWSLDRMLARFGARWDINGTADLAALPLALALLSACSFVATPLFNTMIRTQEQEADVFGLNAARQPDGFAEAALQLSEYRKMEPGPMEEFIFYDHPSGATRIRTAMRWKAEHLADSPNR